MVSFYARICFFFFFFLARSMGSKYLLFPSSLQAKYKVFLALVICNYNLHSTM